MRYDCPHCKQKLEFDSNIRIYNLYCTHCDIYYAKFWKLLAQTEWYWTHWKRFSDSECRGSQVRHHRVPWMYTNDITKPAPYCLLQNHVPQIHVDDDFHEWYSGFKLRVKDGAE